MTNRVMTPKEVLEYGQRILVFPSKQSKMKREFLVENGKIFQEFTLFSEGSSFTLKANPVEIFEIYPRIERVYSRPSKGILLAQRSGQYSSKDKRLLPLVKTGKGLPSTSRLPEKRIQVALEYLEYLDRIRHKQIG